MADPSLEGVSLVQSECVTLSNHWYDVDKLVQSLHELNINSPQTVNNKQTNNKIT